MSQAAAALPGADCGPSCGLTNVKVDITVTDTKTHTVKHYSNAQGVQFKPIQDTAAFATCP